VSRWTIDLPHHGDPTAPLSTVVDAARSLPTDDARVVTRQIVLALATDGVATVGQALERLEAASPAERRALLDDARQAAGLPTASAVASKASYEAQSRAMFVAAADDVELQLVPGPTGWVDVGALQEERARAHAEAQRRARELELRRAARAAELPALEAEAAAEARSWRGANLMPERTAP
jgi:hypothetical protein